jgi:hypothetical protein
MLPFSTGGGHIKGEWASTIPATLRARHLRELTRMIPTKSFRGLSLAPMRDIAPKRAFKIQSIFCVVSRRKDVADEIWTAEVQRCAKMWIGLNRDTHSEHSDLQFQGQPPREW